MEASQAAFVSLLIVQRPAVGPEEVRSLLFDRTNKPQRSPRVWGAKPGRE